MGHASHEPDAYLDSDWLRAQEDQEDEDLYRQQLAAEARDAEEGVALPVTVLADEDDVVF